MEENKNSVTVEASAPTQSIDRSNEKLIDPETSLNDLLHFLGGTKEAANAGEIEREVQKREAEKARLKEVLGADYRAFYEGRPTPVLEKAKRRPGAIQLRNGVQRIAVKQIGADGLCEAFINGYAVYDNGDRKTVVWIADCCSATYNFTKLRDNEKQYQVEKDTVGVDVLGPVPWYIAVSIRGEDNIERNLDHPKSLGTMSDSEKLEEWELKGNHRWIGGSHFENPEDAYIRKEAREELLTELSPLQQMVYSLKVDYRYKEREIAEIMGIDRGTVKTYWSRAKKKIKKYFGSCPQNTL